MGMEEGVSLVIGGTGGIGSAVVRQLAAAGTRVAFTYRSSSAEADALIADVGGAAIAHQLDLADRATIAALVDAVAREGGGLQSLIYAAGPRVPQIHLSRVDPSDFTSALNAEVSPFFAVVHAALPHLRDCGGCIVAITTAATDRYAIRDGLSAGPKAAIESLVRGFAAEEGRFGVRVNAVGPGMLSDGMATDLIAAGHYDEHALEVARQNIAMRRFGTCADVAEAVCFLASERAGYVSGQVLNVDGGYSL